jgi:capsular polysaccharide transport system permease protein
MRGTMTQLQVVYAILLRETKTRFGAHKLGYLWSVVQPLLWILMFSGFYYAFGRMAPPGTSVVGFLATGIVPYSLFRETAGRSLSAIEANKGLLFYPQVRPLDLVIARVILEGATQLVVLLIIMGGLALYEGQFRIESSLKVVVGLGLASALGASFGLVLCGLSVFSRSVEQLYPALLRPLFWLSAIFHPVESLPKGFRDILVLNPVIHCIELVRDGWFPGYGARHVDALYTLLWILALAYLGLTLERLARKRLELT